MKCLRNNQICAHNNLSLLIPDAFMNTGCILKVSTGSRRDLRKLLRTPQITLMSEILSSPGFPLALRIRSFTSLMVLLELSREGKKNIRFGKERHEQKSL